LYDGGWKVTFTVWQVYCWRHAGCNQFIPHNTL